ncbi:terminase [Rodentibacter haemolyticus]|uniref:Terminase n=1 Tax=Rodentibacter haemolyticus TaxID=2778911 RepID=A0ABX6UX98_9PAST|nr:terminase [Rodentibacter haemolyticus]QPB42669.1 terminase [Rodentibacter haemolyticus]
MSYGKTIQANFATAYARTGNATHALREVLGEERAGKMKPHTLRAKASELLNNYRTQALIEQEKLAMMTRGERLPRYRKPTVRTDLITMDRLEIPTTTKPQNNVLTEINAIRQQLINRLMRKARRGLR